MCTGGGGGSLEGKVGGGLGNRSVEEGVGSIVGGSTVGGSSTSKNRHFIS